MLSKIGMYRHLPSPPSSAGDADFIRSVGNPHSPQDCVDNEILYSVYRGAIDFLLTEDVGIHRKALPRALMIVFSILMMRSNFFGSSSLKKKGSPPLRGLKEDFMYNLKLNDPIFDSLKHDYPEFSEWFRKKSLEHRKCYVSYRDDGSIGALLIYKFEDDVIEITPPLPQKKRMKIATLKVTHVGNKIGELLLKISIDLTIQNGCDEIFLTHFTEENDRLVEPHQ